MIMSHPVSLTLSDEDRDLLQNIVYRGQNWRARERAKTLLLLGEGYSKVEVAQQGFCAFAGSPVLAAIDYILKKIPIFIRERQ